MRVNRHVMFPLPPLRPLLENSAGKAVACNGSKNKGQQCALSPLFSGAKKGSLA